MDSEHDCRTTMSVNGGPEVEVDLNKVSMKLGQHQALQSYVDRLVALSEQKAETAAEIKELAGKAKGDGFDKRALMVLVKRQMETAERRAERLAVADEVERMEAALGVFVETPLGAAAMRAAAE